MSEEREITTYDTKTGETVTRTQVVQIIDTGHEPGEQVQDSETGEIIFPGWRRPMRVIEGAIRMTPTTRETADHAELLRRVLQDAQELSRRGLNPDVRLNAAEREAVTHLLSEIAALRGEVERSLPSISFDGEHAISDHRRWLARQLLDSKLDDGEAYSIAAYHPAITDLRTTQAERQRDELRKALEPFATYPLAVKMDGTVAPDEYQLTGRHDKEGIFRTVTNGDFQRARQALASQGADQ